MKTKLFKQVRFRLTCLFTTIAGLILIFLSLAWLHTSEQALKDNQYLSFLRESDTIFSNLEKQNTLSYSLLSTVANNKNLFAAIYDNDRLLSFADATLSDEQKALSSDILAVAKKQLSDTPVSEHAYVHTDFSYEGKDGSTWYANTARIKYSSSFLDAVIVFSPRTLEKQIASQRLFFLLIDLAGIVFFLLFSFFYTGKLLTPIQENQKKQNDFIAAASHELRTPLAVILASAGAIHQIDRSQEHFLHMIKKEGRRLSALINDMLFLAGTDSHTLSLSIKEAEPDTLLLDSYEKFLEIAKKKPVKLLIELPETELPLLACDAERISQVLSILLSNAVSYGKKDGKIRLSLHTSSSALSFVVADNGPGIPEEAKPHIFDRFYRTDPARGDQEHFGLGLCIAKEIIDLHHGRITVSDTPGGGATFTITLPLPP
ncbi:MAG: HAMP domain-containing histidine kinase [Roseburia sp.]|nr:HAMP domain-containing histidine kinase [Roseburia sp.]